MSGTLRGPNCLQRKAVLGLGIAAVPGDGEGACHADGSGAAVLAGGASTTAFFHALTPFQQRCIPSGRDFHATRSCIFFCIFLHVLKCFVSTLLYRGQFSFGHAITFWRERFFPSQDGSHPLLASPRGAKYLGPGGIHVGSPRSDLSDFSVPRRHQTAPNPGDCWRFWGGWALNFGNRFRVRMGLQRIGPT